MEKVNIALQVLPSGGDKGTYELVDEAIACIQRSGLNYQVCPFETVIEGPYDEVMQVAKQAQDACLAAGAEKLMVYIKIQRTKGADVTIDDKMTKYK